MRRHLLIAAAIAMFVAGCGSSGAGSSGGVAAKPYVSQVDSAERRLVSAVQQISPGGNPAVWVSSVKAMRAGVSKLAADLAAIRPPGVVATAHRRLVAVVRRLADRLGAAVHTARDPARLQVAKAQLLRAFTDASDAFTATISQINVALRSATHH
jgi:hypothetical protein